MKVQVVGSKEEAFEVNSKAINTTIKSLRENRLLETNDISDGYHTFGELYEHRITLYIALCKLLDTAEFSCSEGLPWCKIWRSQRHSDGSIWDGWFILGIDKAKGHQITYHLPLSKWSECEFAETLDKAPEWDGHTSNDVLERLKNL
jgi:hypothetical protein